MQHGGHPDRLGAGAVLAQVVHEHALLRRRARPLGAEHEDLRLRLVHADVARDHDPVEELRERRAVIAPGAHRVRDKARPDALRTRAPQCRKHRLVRPDVPEHALDETRPPRGLELEQLPEALAELVLGQLALLERRAPRRARRDRLERGA